MLMWVVWCKNYIPFEIEWEMRLQNLQADTNSSSTRTNMSRNIKTFVQVEKFVTDADSKMPPSVGILLTEFNFCFQFQFEKLEMFALHVNRNICETLINIDKKFCCLPSYKKLNQSL